MNWEAIGAIGEILGAGGVVLTLVYLASQLRQNTLSNRTTAYQSWVENSSSSNEFAREIFPFRNKALFDPENLSEEEKAKFDYYFIGVMNTLEAAFFMKLQGTIDEIYWEAKIRTITMVMEWPGFRQAWGEYRNLYDERFATIVDETVAVILSMESQVNTAH